MNFEVILLIFILCEAFELKAQKGSTLNEYIANLLYSYKDGTVIFLLKNPTFFVSLITYLYLNTQGIAFFILFSCKALDIICKLLLLKRLTKNEPLGIFEAMLSEDIKISFSLKLGISIFYIILFTVSFLPFA